MLKKSWFYSLYKGVTLNKYEVLHQIGEGTFADVYFCRKCDSGKPRVIKFFKQTTLSSRAAVANWCQEIMIHHNLDYPAVVKTFEFGTEGIIMKENGQKKKLPILYMVMEYVESDLLTLMEKQGRPKETQARHLFRQIVEGVGYIHS